MRQFSLLNLWFTTDVNFDSVSSLIGIAVFGFVTSVTPGPNNTYLLTSGMNFGTRRSLTYINGIMVGLVLMFSAIYLGVGALFDAYPQIQEWLKYVGFAYILYMAYGIISSSFASKHEEIRQVGFFRATLFQLVNPKAWIVVMSVVAAYLPEQPTLPQVAWTLAVFLIATYPGAVIWAAFGEAMSGLLSKTTPRRIFNITAAVLLVASMVPVLFL
jgi:threonine/homoserine/homoserine lactone efflux protein